MLQWLTRVLRDFPWFGRDPHERLMRELDTGMFDDAVEVAAAGNPAPAAQEQYAGVKPFDADAWAASRKADADRAKDA
jgi:hypothetical protein